MYNACHSLYSQVDLAILAAAVADFRPKIIAGQKIKKDQAALSIELEPTLDILASLGEIKKKQLLVGFALETENEIENAKKKLIKKNLDFIVLNSLNDAGAGFGSNTNKITIIDKNEQFESFELKDKTEVAKDIFNILTPVLNE